MKHAGCGGELAKTYGRGNYRCKACREKVAIGNSETTSIQLERRFSLWAQREQRRKDLAAKDACPSCGRVYGCNCHPLEWEDWADHWPISEHVLPPDVK